MLIWINKYESVDANGWYLLAWSTWLRLPHHKQWIYPGTSWFKTTGESVWILLLSQSLEHLLFLIDPNTMNRCILICHPTCFCNSTVMGRSWNPSLTTTVWICQRQSGRTLRTLWVFQIYVLTSCKYPHCFKAQRSLYDVLSCLCSWEQPWWREKLVLWL